MLRSVPFLSTAFALGIAACAAARDRGAPVSATGPVITVEAAPDAAAGDPRDAICTSLQAASAAVRAGADEELRAAYVDPIRLGATRRKLEERLARARSELARWSDVLAREKAKAKPDPDTLAMDTSFAESSRFEVTSLTAQLAAPPPSAPLVEESSSLRLPPYLNKCAKVEDGVWATVLEELHLIDPESTELNERTPSGRWMVVHVGLDGTRAEIMPVAGLHWPWELPADGGLPMHNLASSVTEDVFAPEPVAFDFDGDGHSEYVVTIGYHLLSMLSDEISLWGHVLTVKDGVVVLYDPAKAIAVGSVSDENGDGRPDLVTISQHHEEADADCASECVGEWVTDRGALWLSRIGGTFVQTPWPKTKDAGGE